MAHSGTMNINRSFSVFDLMNKYGFSEGEMLLPEEKPLVRIACHKLVKALGVVADRWQPVVLSTLKNPYYVTFRDLMGDPESGCVSFYHMPERAARTIQERLDSLGLSEVSCDEDSSHPFPSTD